MILVFDVGNTAIKVGAMTEKGLACAFKLLTKQSRSSDEIGFALVDFLNFHGLNKADFEGGIISSVVPSVNHSLVNAVKKYMGFEPIMVDVGIKTKIKIQTENNREVGADRIVDALAAYTLYGGPVIVAGFGTATRYDYVTEDGVFCAAVTAPGLRVSADALWMNAAKLPDIEIKKPKSVLAANTVTSMQAGIVYSAIGAAEYIIKEMKREIGRDDIKVVATGGYTNIIAPHTDIIDVQDNELTLKGLYMLYELNKR